MPFYVNYIYIHQILMTTQYSFVFLCHVLSQLSKSQLPEGQFGEFIKYWKTCFF